MPCKYSKFPFLKAYPEMQAHQDHTRTGLLATGAAPTKREPDDGAEVVEVQVIVIDGAATKAKLKKAKAKSKKKLKTKTATTATGQDHNGNGNAAASLAAALSRMMPSISQGSAEIMALALHFLRLVSPDFETLTIAGLVAQCGAGGRVAPAVVAVRQFWCYWDFTFETAPDPRFIEALLTALRDITGVDVGESQAMGHAMHYHEQRARAFAAEFAEEFPGTDPSLLVEFFAAVSYVHGNDGLNGLNGLLGGLIESKEDLATAYNTGWVDRALDHMFCNGGISATSADSLASAIQASLGVSGTSD